MHKVLTIEEIEECNQFLENKIDLESLFQVDGMVYIPMIDYGVMDIFSMGITALDKKATSTDVTKEANGDGGSNQGSDVEGGSQQGGGPPPDDEVGDDQGAGPPPDDEGGEQD